VNYELEAIGNDGALVPSTARHFMHDAQAPVSVNVAECEDAALWERGVSLIDD
jgi:hypothetical protein